MFDLWTKFVITLGLDEFSFAEVYDQVRAMNGKKLAKIERNMREKQFADEVELIAENKEGLKKNVRKYKGSSDPSTNSNTKSSSHDHSQPMSNSDEESLIRKW